VARSIAAPPPGARRRLVIVGWDGADATIVGDLVERGQMPTLARLIDNGVLGRLHTLVPSVSPLLWTSMATGKRPDKHGVLIDRELDPRTGTVTRVSRASCHSRSFWDILGDGGVRTAVVNWPATHPVRPDAGVTVTDAYWSGVPASHEAWPLPDAVVHPLRLRSALEELRVHPADFEPADLLPFVPDLRRLDVATDPRLGMLARILAQTASVHAAATWIAEHEPWDVLAVCYPALEHLAHGFARYLPPRMAGVSADETALFSEVVPAGYRFHDLMLGRLVALAGDDAAVMVVSDHGVALGDQRPDADAPARAWHRGRGLLVAAGPGLRRDELLHHAGILDIAPTILTMCGLPYGADMDGRPLLRLWQVPPVPEEVPSWERADPAAADSLDTTGADDGMLEELHALGYGARPARLLDGISRDLERARDGHLALSQVHAGRFADAALVLRRMLGEDPANAVVRMYLAYCCCRLGELDESRTLLEAVPPELSRERALLDALRLIAEGRPSEALEHLRLTEESDRHEPVTLCLVGAAWARLGDYAAAQEAYARAVEADADHVDAHFGLALVHAKRRQWEATAASARAVVTRDHHRPVAHYLLGVALFHLDRTDEARAAFETVLAIAPGCAPARQWLDRLQRGVIRTMIETGHVPAGI
jgi:Flp pilus assembly protein TadD